MATSPPLSASQTRRQAPALGQQPLRLRHRTPGSSAAVAREPREGGLTGAGRGVLQAEDHRAGLSAVQDKAGTRKHIASTGATIVADFGDRFSDLEGGYAEFPVKLPNPMCHCPDGISRPV
ncbi:HAD family acid phosphatase [Amycolatopsis sp. cmx-11-51]|uniref:HAD family acid phosphatase n=1 Tax=Amycolatopsis sp. cmx-11-51 TaxID=2785797 RepID=UPI0039E504FF